MNRANARWSIIAAKRRYREESKAREAQTIYIPWNWPAWDFQTLDKYQKH